MRYVDLLGGAGYVQPDLGNESLPFPVTAPEAISDLPAITGDSVKRGARYWTTLARYRENEPTSYQKLMREWPGFEVGEGVYDHAIRYLPRDGVVFMEMREGAEYPEAHATAVRIANRKA